MVLMFSSPVSDYTGDLPNWQDKQVFYVF
jgi:hypothetical protein